MRITQDTSDTLHELAAGSGRSMQDILAAAVDAYWRKRLLAETEAAYAALRGDAERWGEESEERASWEVTLTDGVAE